VSQKFENQRAAALAASETLYCYDWPLLFENVAEKNWTDFVSGQSGRKPNLRIKTPGTPATPLVTDTSAHAPPNFFTCTELVMCDPNTQEPLRSTWTAREAEKHAVLLPVKRPPGKNDVGMVAWHVHMSSPECPQGREFVIIANDITFQAGSFGTREDVVFFKVSVFLFALHF
jgi:acetyl-CoA carboxylase/biotin carboxylase 1